MCTSQPTGFHTAGAAHRDVHPDQAVLVLAVSTETRKEDSARDACRTLAPHVHATVSAIIGEHGHVHNVGTVTVRKGRLQWEGRDRITVRTTPEQLTAVQVAVDEIDDVTLMPPTFTVTTAREIERELLGEAISDAQARAEQMAQAVGAQLGAVEHLEESTHRHTPHIHSYADESLGHASLRSRRMSELKVAAPPQLTVPDVQRIEVVVAARWAVA